MSQQGLRRRVHLVAECIRFHSKIEQMFQLGQDSAGDIDALLAAHAKAKRELAIVKSKLRGIMCDSFSYAMNERMVIFVEVKP